MLGSRSWRNRLDTYILTHSLTPGPHALTIFAVKKCLSPWNLLWHNFLTLNHIMNVTGLVLGEACTSNVWKMTFFECFYLIIIFVHYSLQIDKEDEAYNNHEQNIEQLKRR